MPDKPGPMERLGEYRSRRDFDRTLEPSGSGAAAAVSGSEPIFMVQKHAATRLHFDFRLEWSGVLLSWAVTRGPSLDSTQKRLAVRTEDHPLDYATFEGVIPSGQYGGGTVMLWDRGTWQPLDDIEKGLVDGKLKFRLHGERLQGEWHLVRMKERNKPKSGSTRKRRENWLLIKSADNHVAPDDGNPDWLTDHYQQSVSTGRSMVAIKDGVAAIPRDVSEGDGMAAFVEPQLASISTSPPEGEDWLNEMKFDGYRCLAVMTVESGKRTVRCFTRSGKDWTSRFTGVASALQRIDCTTAVLDGEIVAEDKGLSNFSALQQALESGLPLQYRLFDILELNGVDLRQTPQIERKDILEKLLSSSKLGDASKTLRYCVHVTGNGPEVFTALARAGAEGMVSKRIDAPYKSGRSDYWLKTKLRARQEFVICGYSPSAVSGRPFASILLGSFESEGLRYRGRVGSGFSDDTLDAVSNRLGRIRLEKSPFQGRWVAELPASVRKDAVWTKPELVAEIEFAEITSAGHIRQGVFIGLREDKPARQVRLDSEPSPSLAVLPFPSSDLGLTHPNRPVYGDSGITKTELAGYYEQVAERMLPFISGHLLSLVRCPGSKNQSAPRCFFQKHAFAGMPASILTVSSGADDGEASELYLTQADALSGAVQMSTLEFHIQGVRFDLPDKPDRLVFDLDPDEGLDFSLVREAALLIRTGLEAVDLECLPLVTGGKGIHLVAPLRRTADWDQVSEFAAVFAAYMADRFPERFTAKMAKSSRKGRILIDWFRNKRGATAIAPWSTRARPGTPVACPTGWAELAMLNSANCFSPAAALMRLAQPDPWAEWGSISQSVTKTMLKQFQKTV